MEKWKNTFLKNIMLLLSGSLIAQLINFIAAPLMTRFFSADEIGVFAYITTIAYIFTPVICLRYESAIILEKESKDGFSLIKLCIFVCAILSCVVCFCYSLYFILAGKEKYLKYLILLIGLLFISGISNICTAYNTSQQQYKILGKIPIYRAVANLTTITAFGLAKLSVFGLIFGHAITQIVGLWTQGKYLFYNRKKIISKSYKEMMNYAKKYKKLPVYSVPAIFFNNLSYLSINFFVAELYGMEQLAYYSLSVRILGVPLSLISYNIGSVFYEKASREYTAFGSFSSIYSKTFLLLCAICVPVIGTVYLIAPWFCGVYFGNEWSIAGVYVQIMCFLFAVRFVIAPLTSGILILRKNQIEMLCQMAFCIVSFISYLFASYLLWNIELYLLTVSIGFAIVYSVFGIVIYRLS